MGFDIKWGRRQGILVASILGRIDGSKAGRFQAELDSGIDAADRALLLDFEQVSFISSAGLRVGLRVGRRFNKPGMHFGICSLCDPVREVFAASGFDEIIPIYESQAAALGNFTKQTG